MRLRLVVGRKLKTKDSCAVFPKGPHRYNSREISKNNLMQDSEFIEWDSTMATSNESTDRHVTNDSHN